MTAPDERADGPHLVALGGGHGLATTLRAARTYAGRITAVVSVADDGGSSGRLRKQLGIPAPSSIGSMPAISTGIRSATSSSPDSPRRQATSSPPSRKRRASSARMVTY